MYSKALREITCHTNRTPLTGARKSNPIQPIPIFPVTENFGLTVQPLMKKTSPTLPKDYNQKVQPIPSPGAAIKEKSKRYQATLDNAARVEKPASKPAEAPIACPTRRITARKHAHRLTPEFPITENVDINLQLSTSSPIVHKDHNQKLQHLPDPTVKERHKRYSNTAENLVKKERSHKYPNEPPTAYHATETPPNALRKQTPNRPMREHDTFESAIKSLLSSPAIQKDFNQRLIPHLGSVNKEKAKRYSASLDNRHKHDRTPPDPPDDLGLGCHIKRSSLNGARKHNRDFSENFDITIKSLMSSPKVHKDYSQKPKSLPHPTTSTRENLRRYPPAIENPPKKEKSTPKPADEFPMTPDLVLGSYWSCLTKYERREVREYPQIWYLGKKTNKAVVNENQRTGIYNFGFDNECGTYKSIVNDHLAYRFQILKVLGKGFSGEVLKCKDHKTEEIVAIKVFKNLENILWLAKAEKRNLRFMRKSDRKNLECIVHLKDHFSFRKHLCIIFDLYDGDLHQLIRHGNKQRIREEDLKNYAVDILKCLRLLKKMKIVHGDLKPENILLRNKGNEKHAAVTDFGGSYFTCDRTRPPVFTLNYMSPEMLLGKKCRTPIDMWSLGCILAEAHLRERLFKGSEDSFVFNSIVEVLGIPPKEVLHNSPRKHHYFDSSGNPKYIKQITSLEKKLKSGNQLFVDFIQCCLEYDPRKRITPHLALRHPWLQKETKADSSQSSSLSIFRLPHLLNRDRTPASKMQPDATQKDGTKTTVTTSLRPTAAKTLR